MKYFQIDQAVNKMMTETLAAFEAAEIQKAAFIAAGRPYVPDLILEAAAELGYAPHDTFAGLSLEKRQFGILNFDFINLKFKILSLKFKGYIKIFFKSNFAPTHL
jgi:hypothetical protein